MSRNSLMVDFVRQVMTGSGTGDTLVPGAAVTGYQTLASAGIADLDIFYYTIFEADAAGNPAGNFEVGAGYTNGGVLIRSKVFSSSNAGAKVSFGTGTKHLIGACPARVVAPVVVNEARLSLVSETPAPDTDQTAKSVLYLTSAAPTGRSAAPSFILSFCDSGGLQKVQVSQLSLTLAGLVANTNYDVFAYFNASGVVTLDLAPAWTGANLRNIGIASIQGRLVVNSSGFTSVIHGDTVAAFTATYLGTIRTTGTTTTEDSFLKRFVWNYWNRIDRPLQVLEQTASWAYTTATWRQVRATASNKVEVVIGVSEDLVTAEANCIANSTGQVFIASGVGVDSTSVNSAKICGAVTPNTSFITSRALYTGYPGIGYHALNWLEYSAATGTTTWWSNQATWLATGISGLTAVVKG